MSTPTGTAQPQPWLRVPATVWALGFVSLLMDASSEMIHALLPLYMVGVLGTSALSVGIIEGIAEATAQITKLFSGALSDRWGRRKPLVALGYGLAALTKPVFPLAATLPMLVTARFLDRIGKGIRGAPRDALIADVTAPALRGAAFGLRQALDTVGGVLGPLLAIGFMLLFAGDYRSVFWMAVIPAALSVALIFVAVREPPAVAHRQATAPRLSRALLAELPGRYWLVVAVASLFTLARFSEAFLVLRAQSVGLDAALAPLVMVVMSLVYAAAALPAGLLSDRWGRNGLLAAGFALLVVADLVLAFPAGIPGVLLGTALWGLHMGLTQGLLSALVADTAPAHLRGTGFGMFSLATGIALLAASLVAGALWDWLGPSGTFLAGAGFTALALLALPLALRRAAML